MLPFLTGNISTNLVNLDSNSFLRLSEFSLFNNDTSNSVQYVSDNYKLFSCMFVDLLIDALFKPTQQINREHKFKYIYLLAFAACVHETWQEVGKLIIVHVFL